MAELFRFGKKSRKILSQVHPDLRLLAGKALSITEVDFAVYEGLRTPERQLELFHEGATWTLDSRHITGHAIDVAPYINGGLRWDWPLYDKIAAAFFRASGIIQIPIVWGGYWPVRDGPHFELMRKYYPEESE